MRKVRMYRFIMLSIVMIIAITKTSQSYSSTALIATSTINSYPINNTPSTKSQKKSFTCKEQLTMETCAKIGQMLIVGFGGLEQDENGKIIWEDPNSLIFKKESNIAKEIKELHIGGVILFTRAFRNKKTGAFIRERNIQNPEQAAKLTRDLQNYSKQVRRETSLIDLPLLISIDQEGGMIDRLPRELGFSQKTLIPQALGANEERALSLNKEEDSKNIKQKEKTLSQTRSYANNMAEILQQLHFNLNFAPCVDVNINPLNPILGGKGRCFSANPDIVAEQAWEFVQAFHAKGIIATLKHFPGHGSSTADSHEGLVNVTDTYEKENELLPYQKLIKQGYQDIIMTAHVINGQIDKSQCKKGDSNDPTTWCPGTLSYTTVTKLLRETLGFKGVVVSDDMTMDAIANEYPIEVALEKAINAGVDMFIIANNTSDDSAKMVNTIAQLVKEGKVTEQQIDNAYLRIKKLKQSYNNS